MSESIQSMEARIKAWDAERAIPDRENAILKYAELLSDYTSITSLADLTGPLDQNQCSRISKGLNLDVNILEDFRPPVKNLNEPWAADESPETINWLKKYHQDFSILLEGSQIERLYIPADNLRQLRWDNLLFEVIRHSSYAFACATFLDMGEERFEHSLEKAMAMVRMGNQFMQEPLDCLMEFGFGSISKGLGIVGLHLMNPSIVLSEETLDALQVLCSQPTYDWESIAYQKKLVDTLVDKYYEEDCNQCGSRIAPLDCDWAYERWLSLRRQYRLFIEFRRYRNRTGHWPSQLDEVRDLIPNECWEELKGSRPFILWFSRKCFVMCRPGEESNKRQYEILVYNKRLLWPGEKVLIVKQIQACIELLKDRNHLYLEMKQLLRQMGRLATPVLRRNAKHANPRIREEVNWLLKR